MKITGNVQGKNASIDLCHEDKNMLNYKPETIIISSQVGFAPLGLLLNEIDDKKTRDSISYMADSIYHASIDNLIVRLVRVNYRSLKSLIMIPSAECEYFHKNWSEIYGFSELWFQFIFVMTFIGIDIATFNNYQNVGITHIGGGFNSDCAKTIYNGIGAYLDKYESSINQVVFSGCCINEKDLIMNSGTNIKTKYSFDIPIYEIKKQKDYVDFIVKI